MSTTANQQSPCTSSKNIGIVGYGNMGRAIATILHTALPKKHNIYVLSKNATSDNFVTAVSSYEVLCKKSDIVFFCIKPQDFYSDTAVFNTTYSSPIIVSIMAGVRIAEIQKKIKYTKIIRTMPNLPLHIGQGVIGYYARRNALSKAEQKTAMHILHQCGTVVTVHKESMIDAITAVSGSGPAYVYLFMDALIHAAQDLGFNDKQAHTLVAQTITGSVAYAAAQRQTDIKDLITRITSKKGTTEAALEKIPRKNFYLLWRTALRAAHKRATELSVYDTKKS